MGLRAMLEPAIVPAYGSSAARMARRALFGPRRFPGDAPAICAAIVEACWNGRCYTASAGHFRQFWTRDFGFSAEALVWLGHADRVEASLAWALAVWARRGRVTTTIFPGARPADIYTLGVDSLPLLFRAIRALERAGEGRGERLVARHARWLIPELARYAQAVLDGPTGLVRTDRRFATHRDTVRTTGNAYGNAMVAHLDSILRETGWLASPIPAGASQRFVEEFWCGDHVADLPRGAGRTGRASGQRPLSGDANVVPFWVGVLPAELGLAAALAALDREGFTRPLPLRYATRRDPAVEDPIQRIFVPDYQGRAIWTSLGLMTVALRRRVDPATAAAELEGHAALVRRDGTLWEVLGDDLRPYRGRLGLWRADEAMLWAALLLELLETAEVAPRPVPPAPSPRRG